MGYNAPSDFATSHKVTSAEWNAQLGTSGSMAYLYAQSHTVSQSDVTASRALDTSNNHIYQNTSGKLMMVTVSVFVASAGQLTTGSGVAYDGASSPPTTVVGKAYIYPTGTAFTGGVTIPITFWVPPSYYYKVANESNTGSCTLIAWIEWTLF